MKKHLSLILLLAILVSGCSQEELSRNESANGRTFTASFEQNESRTYIEDSKHLRWTTGDLISLFNSNTLNQQYKFNGKTGDNSGTFSKVETVFGTGNDLNCHYAVYPYASNITITESGLIAATMPAEQVYAENSFGLGANTMVAVTEDTDDTFLKFKNVGGYLKLQLYGDNVTVKSITLTGNNNEKLAGAATITPVYGQDPTISMDDDATEDVTLDCGEGVEIGSTAETATAFWIVVPPTTFENGFDVTITDVNDNEFVKSTSNEISIARNTIKPMPAFEVEIESGAEIVYDVQIAGTLKDLLPADYLTMTSLKVKGYLNGADIAVIREMSAWDIYNPENISTKLVNLDMSEASIVASDDKYYGQLTTLDNTIGEYMFAETILENIFLPKTVTSIDEYAFNNTHLKYINIPPSVLSLSNNAFPGYCQFTINITDLVAWFNIQKQYGSSIYEYKLVLNNEEVKAITIPLQTSNIKNYTFYLCKSIESVEIPETVTELGTHIFYGCSNLTNAVLPNSIKFIPPYTFSNSGLKEVTIGNDVATIWYAAFSNCPIEKFYSHTAVPPILKSDFNGQNLPPFQNVNKETATLYVPIGCKAAYEATEWNNYFTIVEMAVE